MAKSVPKLSENLPWKKIPQKTKDFILYGDEYSNINIKKYSNFEGIINFIDKKYNQTERFWIQYELEKYLSERDCEVCQGYRLNEKALAVKIEGNHIGHITKKSITACLKWFRNLESKLTLNETKIVFALKT